MPSLFNGDRVDLPSTQTGEIYYEIESLSYRETWAESANKAEAVLRVAGGTNTRMFVTAMVGRAYVTNSGGSHSTPVLNRDLPENVPYRANSITGGQYCTRLDQIDQGGDPAAGTDASPKSGGPGADADGWPDPKWTRWRATFEGMPFAMATDSEANSAGSFSGTCPELQRYVWRQRRSKVKEQQIPSGGWYVIGSAPKAKIPGLTFFKRIAFADVQYVWYRVPVAHLPIAACEAALGSINDLEFDGGPGGYAFFPGTLLYSGYDDTKRYYDANGDWVCDLVHQFESKTLGTLILDGTDIVSAAYGWNYFLDFNGNVVEVSSDGTKTGQRPYNTSDFTQLFRVQ